MIDSAGAEAVLLRQLDSGVNQDPILSWQDALHGFRSFIFFVKMLRQTDFIQFLNNNKRTRFEMTKTNACTP